MFLIVAATFLVAMFYLFRSNMVGKKTRDDVLTASIASVAKNESPYKSRQAQLRDNIRAKHGHNTRFEQKPGNGAG